MAATSVNSLIISALSSLTNIVIGANANISASTIANSVAIGVNTWVAGNNTIQMGSLINMPMVYVPSGNIQIGGTYSATTVGVVVSSNMSINGTGTRLIFNSGTAIVYNASTNTSFASSSVGMSINNSSGASAGEVLRVGVDNGSTVSRFDTTVGIGVSPSTNAALDVIGNAVVRSRLMVGTSSVISGYNLYVGGSTLTTYFAGNVGIGVTSPLATLDMSGNIIIRGSAANLVIGNVVSGDAAMRIEARSGISSYPITLNPSGGVIAVGKSSGFVSGVAVDVSGSMAMSGSLLVGGITSSSYTIATNAGGNLRTGAAYLGVNATAGQSYVLEVGGSSRLMGTGGVGSFIVIGNVPVGAIYNSIDSYLTSGGVGNLVLNRLGGVVTVGNNGGTFGGNVALEVIGNVTISSGMYVGGSVYSSVVMGGNVMLVGGALGATGLVTCGAGVAVTAGGLTVSAGGLTVTAGGLTVSAGGLTVSTGNIVASSGSVVATSGNVDALNMYCGNTLTFSSSFVGSKIILYNASAAGGGSNSNHELRTNGTALQALVANSVSTFDIGYAAASPGTTKVTIGSFGVNGLTLFGNLTATGNNISANVITAANGLNSTSGTSNINILNVNGLLTCASNILLSSAGGGNILASAANINILTTNGSGVGNVNITTRDVYVIGGNINALTGNVNSARLLITGGATFSGDMSIIGNITASGLGHNFGNVTIGNVSVSSLCSVGSLSVSGVTTMTGNVQMGANLTVLNRNLYINSGFINATGSGHVLGILSVNASNISVSGTINCTGGLTVTGNISASATGHSFGNVTIGNALLTEANVTGGTFRVNNMLIQGDGSNGYMRARVGTLYMGYGTINMMSLGSGNIATISGTLVIDETVTGVTPVTASVGSMTLRHSGNGHSSIVFPSGTNGGSDYGVIQYISNVYGNTAYTNVRYFADGATSEQGMLRLTVQNDPGSAGSRDGLLLHSAGHVIVDCQNYTAGNLPTAANVADLSESSHILLGPNATSTTKFIGINTLTPQSRLHVEGNIYANGNINATDFIRGGSYPNATLTPTTGSMNIFSDVRMRAALGLPIAYGVVINGNSVSSRCYNSAFTWSTSGYSLGTISTTFTGFDYANCVITAIVNNTVNGRYIQANTVTGSGIYTTMCVPDRGVSPSFSYDITSISMTFMYTIFYKM